METFGTQVKKLVEAAAEAKDARDAMMFSQAALNAAHAEQVLSQVTLKK